MSILSLFRGFKQEPSTFEGMTKSQKKEFLSNDLVERMIRIEQKVSSHVGKPTHYKSTQYYKSLTEHQRHTFEKYLKHKDKKLFFLSCLTFLSLLGLGGITGNVVLSLSSSGLRIGSLVAILLCLLLIAYILIRIYEKKKRHKRLSNIHHMANKTLKH